MNVKKIVEMYLFANGYDGLYKDELECGCTKDDLMPCDCNFDTCEPGYKVLQDDGDWLIKKEKP